jgi:hypothetical protein
MIPITTPHQGVLLETFPCPDFYFDRAFSPCARWKAAPALIFR